MKSRTPDWQSIREHADRFPPAAFAFVHDGLGHTVEMVHGRLEQDNTELTPAGESARHVSGQQLCMGLRDLAIQRWGVLAPTVLRRWSIHKTLDFGMIVYALIDRKILRGSDDDSLDDFECVFDFDEAFAPEAVLGLKA